MELSKLIRVLTEAGASDAIILAVTKAYEKPKRSKQYEIFDHGFADFWQAYPKHYGSKAKAKDVYDRLIKDGIRAETLIAGATRYANHCTDPKYTKHPVTWLNQRCWEIDYPPHQPAQPKPTGTDQFMSIAYRMLTEGKDPG